MVPGKTVQVAYITESGARTIGGSLFFEILVSKKRDRQLENKMVRQIVESTYFIDVSYKWNFIFGYKGFRRFG